ncbi:cold shock domain-containing protein [Weissella coleopterorum]|uniref:Cold shock domain-containing protein n=1 Tax=Weissella coleopterorum TaxID=2714949 RepID=A0A6G8B151_9LACO|nr:cold shock domain-containing protein [Weissella coleopterorum]QIL50967.1 cold shock domain-containing protein [Weissella coleopterorum]
MEKISGTVKSWNEKDGYGYIEIPNEDDVFVHFSGIEDRNRNLTIGENVKLVVINGVRGPQAALVSRDLETE